MFGFRSAVIFALLVATIMLNLFAADPVAAAKVGVDRQRFVDPRPTPETKPPFSSHRNVSIGMKADEVRKTLGDPKDKSDAEDFYLFGESESMQVYYDAGHSVTAISVTIYNELAKAPTAKAVVGQDVRPNADGSISKTVRFPKAGFWVSYSKTAGDSPTISITIQKI